MNDSTALVPEAQRFATPAYALAGELASLIRVHQAGAPEATVFYCARMIEALSAVGVERVGSKPSENSFSNLTMLEQDGLLTSPASFWAHGLRRLGNDVRHLRRGLSSGDAEAALIYAERWLDWFFCRFVLGPSLPSITRDGSPLTLAADNTWREVVAAIDRTPTKEAMIAIATGPGTKDLAAATPTVSAVVAEALIDMGQTTPAEEILSLGLERFPAELRLRQLQALIWSRTGRLDQACQALEGLSPALRRDEETVGILAGVYKRMWSREHEAPKWLEKSHAAYRRGWEDSKNTNTYLGINAATTALWLGRKESAQKCAGQIQQFFFDRCRRLAAVGLTEPAGSYWEALTLAEAELLLENWPAANQAYADALARHSRLEEAIEVSRTQAKRILVALGGREPEVLLPALYFEPAAPVD